MTNYFGFLDFIVSNVFVHRVGMTVEDQKFELKLVLATITTLAKRFLKWQTPKWTQKVLSMNGRLTLWHDSPKIGLAEMLNAEPG